MTTEAEICIGLKGIYYDRNKNSNRHIVSIHFTCVKLLTVKTELFLPMKCLPC